MPAGNPLDEYKLVSENLRWYCNIRFAQLTLFLAVTAAVFNGAFNTGEMPALITVLLKAGGLVAAIVFWYLEKRADDYWSYFMERAEQLDRKLIYRQYVDRPKKQPRTTYVIRSFIGLVGLFWLVALLSPYVASS